MIVKFVVSNKVADIEYIYFNFDKNTSKIQKFLKIINVKEQSVIFIAAIITCILISVHITSYRVCLLLVILCSIFLGFDSNPKEVIAELKRAIIIIVLDKFLLYIVPLVILVGMFEKVMILNNDLTGYVAILFATVTMIKFCWDIAINKEIRIRRQLDKEWRKMKEDIDHKGRQKN